MTEIKHRNVATELMLKLDSDEYWRLHDALLDAVAIALMRNTLSVAEELYRLLAKLRLERAAAVKKDVDAQVAEYKGAQK